MKFRKFRKNAKALSPVIATIILIAVTVAVSVVVAAWMGALTIGFMGNSEQASITNTVLSNSGTGGVGVATLTVQNTGSASVTISTATIDGTTATFTVAPAGPIAKGTSSTVTLTWTSAFTNTAQYTIKLMTAKGNAVVTQASYTGS
jgi:flagellin-like protein